MIAGTSAEWLFMSEGRRMLTVKGVRGGENAPVSSFAISAAGFGRTPEVRPARLLRCAGFAAVEY